jgi:hypothetical protein
MQIQVIKRNGETAFFDTQKLKQALQNAGASALDQERIAKLVETKIYHGITTQRIYQIAFNLLKRDSLKIAGRYRLKNAIKELGPTGFPFEIFVGKIFETMGYEVQTGVFVKGKCIVHEVDVVARKPGEMIMIECKFHSDNRTKSSVQVPLYIQSRFLDVKAAWEEQFGKDINYRGGVVTNTRFSEDAEKYGKCAGLLVISWDYPGDLGLKNMIDKSGLHPVTSLISLTKKDKQHLIEKGIVLCSQLIKNDHLLHDLGMTSLQIKKVLNEAGNLISD